MDKEQRIAQHNAIKAQLQSLTEAVDAYSGTFEKNISSDDLEAIGQISQCQVAMVERVKQMQSAIYGPLNMIMLHYEEVRPYLPSCSKSIVRTEADIGWWAQCLRSSSVRTLLEMGVFDALPVDGSEMSAEELAKKLGVDEALLSS